MTTTPTDEWYTYEESVELATQKYPTWNRDLVATAVDRVGLANKVSVFNGKIEDHDEIMRGWLRMVMEQMEYLAEDWGNGR